jgi:hypothetical protein
MTVFTDILPTTSHLHPDFQDPHCPEAWRVLVTLALSSAVVTLLRVVMGHRGVVRVLTLRLLGKIYERRPTAFQKFRFALQFLLPLILQLGGNALVVYIIFPTPGYVMAGRTGRWTYFFPFAARPRHTWMALALLSTVERTRWFLDYYPWRIASAANAFSEFVLQVLGLFTIGGIARFGDQADYEQVWSWKYQHLPQAAKIFYSASFLYVVMGVFGMIPLVLVWCSVVMGFWKGEAVIADTVMGLGQWETKSDRKDLAVMTLVCLFVSWLASWMFWIGYVLMSEPYQA